MAIINEFSVLIAVLAAWNIAAFLVMMIDKMRAEKHASERISEGMMFFLAAVFGSIGIYAGMFAFRHKTKKWYFLIGLPLLILQNTASAYLIYQIINQVN